MPEPRELLGIIEERLLGRSTPMAAQNLAVSGPDAAADQAAVTLAEAVGEGSRPPSHTVLTALLALERQIKQQHQTLPVEALLGTWRLQFTAPKKPAYKAGEPVGKGFYLPRLAVATIAFGREADNTDDLTVQNQLRVGPLKLRFIGPAKWQSKKNLLAFDFVRLQVFLGRLKVLNLRLGGDPAQAETFSQTPIGKLPFFAFFAVTSDYMAARGRGGGLALWMKESDASEAPTLSHI